MNLPDTVVKKILSEYSHINKLEDRLFEASEIYNNLIKQRKIVDKLKKDYDEQVAIELKVVQSCQDGCFHIWEEHRSGVDSADNYSQCLVCGKCSI